MVHTNYKGFKCDECEFARVTKGKLKETKELIDSGVFYPCDYPGCLKSDNLKGNLYTHRFRVHKISRPMAKKKEWFLWVLKILWVYNWGCIFISHYLIKFSSEKSAQRPEYHLFLGPFNIQFSTRICCSC